MGRTPRGQVFILDVQHERLSSLGVEKMIKDTARSDHEKYGGRVKIRLEQEPGASGKRTAFNYVTELLAGYPAEAMRTDERKETKALPLAAQQEARNVALCNRYDEIAKTYVKPQWHEEFVEEAAVFPSGTHDDMVDAASEAFLDLLEFAKRRKRAETRTMAGERIGEQPVVPGGIRGATRPPGS
jgi:predicted phage terminase large subunit-like protein